MSQQLEYESPAAAPSVGWLVASVFALVAIALAIGVMPWYCWHEEIVQRLIRSSLAREQDPGQWEKSVDRLFWRAGPEGDLALRFIGFPPDDPALGVWVGTMVGRGTYAVYPRKLVFAREGTVVMVGPAVLQSNFNPNMEWLQQRNVRWIFTYSATSGPARPELTPLPLPGGTTEGMKDTPPGAARPPVTAIQVLWGLLYVIVLLVAGCAITFAIIGNGERRSLAEIGGLVLTLGMGGAAMLMIWISMLGIRTGRGVVLFVGASAVFTLVILFRRGWVPRPRLPDPPDSPWQMNLLLIVPLLFLILATSLSLLMAVAIPIVGWDSFVMWGLKAKVLYADALTPRPAYFTDVRLGFTHLDYPLLLPMLLAGSYSTVGRMHEQLAKVVLPMLFAGQMLLCYTGARLWLRRLPALLPTTLLICLPVGLEFCSVGTAELPLATFWLGSVLYLVRWVRSGQRADAILCALFAVFVANTKNEGLPMAGFVAMTMVVIAILRARSVGRRAMIDAAILVMIVAVGAGIWAIWRSPLPHVDENYPAQLRWSVIHQNLNRIGPILLTTAKTMAYPYFWGGFWLLLPLLAGIGFRAFARVEGLTLWAVFLLHLGLYGLIYVITVWDVAALMHDSMGRLLLHVAPIATLLMAAHLAAILNSVSWPSTPKTSPVPSNA